MGQWLGNILSKGCLVGFVMYTQVVSCDKNGSHLPGTGDEKRGSFTN